MQAQLTAIIAKATTELGGLKARPEFEAAKARYVGPNGELTALMKSANVKSAAIVSNVLPFSKEIKNYLEPELKKLYESEDEVRNLIDLARSLEGLTRNAGVHAGGVVIAPSVLTDFAPLYRDDSGGSGPLYFWIYCRARRQRPDDSTIREPMGSLQIV